MCNPLHLLRICADFFPTRVSFTAHPYHLHRSPPSLPPFAALLPEWPHPAPLFRARLRPAPFLAMAAAAGDHSEAAEDTTGGEGVVEPVGEKRGKRGRDTGPKGPRSELWDLKKTVSTCHRPAGHTPPLQLPKLRITYSTTPTTITTNPPP